MFGLARELSLGLACRGGGAAAAPVIANPPLFSDLAAYWRMDASGTMSLTGALVDQINDLSGHGNHLTETLTTRPTYDSFGGGQVKFDGLTQKLTIPNTLTVDRRAVSIFVVARRNGSSTTSSALINFPPAAVDLRLYHVSTSLGVTSVGSISSNIRHGGGVQASGVFEAHWLIGAAAASRMGIGQEVFAGAVLSAGTASGGHIGQANGALPYKGLFKAVLVYGRELSLAEKDTVLDFLESEFDCLTRARETFIDFDGDSLTQGIGTSDQTNYAYPYQMSLLVAGGPPKIYNDGNSGDQLVTAANLAATSPLLRLTTHGAYTNRVVLALWGTNDINAGRTDAQVKADIDTYIANIRTGDPGAKIIMGTLLPRTAFNGTQNGYKASVNAYILSGAAHDGFIDFAVDPRLDDSTDLTYYADGTHCTDAGYAAMAELAHAKFVAMGWL